MKVLEGKITSVKMNKTLVVEVSRVKPHPLYRKLVRLSKKFKVDNTGFEELDVGTDVRIQEVKPISKEKHFKIIEVIDKNIDKKPKAKKAVRSKAAKKESRKETSKKK